MKKIILLALLNTLITKSFGQIQLLSEGFESGIPSSWGIFNMDGLNPVETNFSQAWISTPDPGDIQNLVVASTSYFSPIGISNRWLVTPNVSIGNYGNVLAWKSKSQDASFPDSYLVLLSKSGSQVSDFSDTIGVFKNESFEWVEHKIDLSQKGYSLENIYIAFVNNTNNGFKLYLDSVNISKEDPANIKTINEELFYISPNPVSDYIKIASNYIVSKIIIKNNLGQEVSSENTNEINVSNLKPGIYLIEVITRNGVINKSFLKD